MARFHSLKATKEGKEEALKTANLEDACCVPLCPDACGFLPGVEERITQPKEGKAGLDRVVLLTKEGAERLFNGEDNEISTRDDLIELQRDGWVKVTGRCSGQIWHVRKDEIVKIERG